MNTLTRSCTLNIKSLPSHLNLYLVNEGLMVLSQLYCYSSNRNKLVPSVVWYIGEQVLLSLAASSIILLQSVELLRSYKGIHNSASFKIPSFLHDSDVLITDSESAHTAVFTPASTEFLFKGHWTLETMHVFSGGFRLLSVWFVVREENRGVLNGGGVSGTP